jgi:hypothetical protein
MKPDKVLVGNVQLQDKFSTLQRMKSFPGLTGIWLSSLLLCFSGALSQELYPVSIDQKIARSTLIVEGKVIGRQSAWNDAHTMIFTTNQVEVYKVFKGSLSKNIIL